MKINKLKIFIIFIILSIFIKNIYTQTATNNLGFDLLPEEVTGQKEKTSQVLEEFQFIDPDELSVHNFNNGTAKNAFGLNDSIWLGPPGIVEPQYDCDENPYEGKYCVKIFRDTRTRGTCVWYTPMRKTDISKYKYLVFYIRGSGENERYFLITLRDGKDTRVMLKSQNYIKRVTKEWQKVSIPLKDFVKESKYTLDLTQIVGISWTWWGTSHPPIAGTIYLDDIKFSKKEEYIKKENFNIGGQIISMVKSIEKGDLLNSCDYAANFQKWDDAIRTSLSRDYVTEGNFSVKCDFVPGISCYRSQKAESKAWFACETFGDAKDWSDKGLFTVDIYNPNDFPIRATVAFVTKEYSWVQWRWINLNKGWNTIVVELTNRTGFGYIPTGKTADYWISSAPFVGKSYVTYYAIGVIYPVNSPQGSIYIDNIRLYSKGSEPLSSAAIQAHLNVTYKPYDDMEVFCQIEVKNMLGQYSTTNLVSKSANMELDSGHIKYGERHSIRLFYNEDITPFDSVLGIVKKDESWYFKNFKDGLSYDDLWNINKRNGRWNYRYRPTYLSGAEVIGSFDLFDYKAFMINSSWRRNYFGRTTIYGTQITSEENEYNKISFYALHKRNNLVVYSNKPVENMTSIENDSYWQTMVGIYPVTKVGNILFMKNVIIFAELAKTFTSYTNIPADKGYSYAARIWFNITPQWIQIKYIKTARDVIRDLTYDWGYNSYTFEIYTIGNYGEKWKSRVVYKYSGINDRPHDAEKVEIDLWHTPNRKVLKKSSVRWYLKNIRGRDDAKLVEYPSSLDEKEQNFILSTRICPVPIKFLDNKLFLDTYFLCNSASYSKFNSYTVMNELLYNISDSLSFLISHKDKFYSPKIWYKNLYIELKYVNDSPTEITFSYGRKPFTIFDKNDNESIPLVFRDGDKIYGIENDQTIDEYRLQVLTRF